MPNAPSTQEDRLLSPHDVTNSSEPDAGTVSMHRVRRIERLLGTRIVPLPSEAPNDEVATYASRQDQAIRLLQAFNRITDTEFRANVLAMVEAAAERDALDE